LRKKKRCKTDRSAHQQNNQQPSMVFHYQSS
jgi:hypothetical protein